MNPFTKIIYKKSTGFSFRNSTIVFLYHPVDLRDKLKLTTKYNEYPRDVHRSDISVITSDASVLVHYEE